MASASVCVYVCVWEKMCRGVGRIGREEGMRDGDITTLPYFFPLLCLVDSAAPMMHSQTVFSPRFRTSLFFPYLFWFPLCSSGCRGSESKLVLDCPRRDFFSITNTHFSSLLFSSDSIRPFSSATASEPSVMRGYYSAEQQAAYLNRCLLYPYLFLSSFMCATITSLFALGWWSCYSFL